MMPPMQGVAWRGSVIAYRVAVGYCFVPILGPDPHVFFAWQFHFYFPEFVVIGTVGWFVDNHILVAKFVGNLREAALQFNNFRGEESPASSFFSHAFDIFILTAIDHSALHAEKPR